MSLLPARFTRVFAGGVVPLLGLGLAVLIGSQALTSCGSDDDGTTCVPGESKACAGPGACTGTQFCLASGREFSQCDCSGGNAGSAGAAGSSSSGASSGAGGNGSGGASMTPPIDGPRGTVGLPCESASDCPGGLDCIPSSANGPFQNGGPEGGYCTTTCVENADCQAFDALSGCVLDYNGGTPDDTSDDVSYCIAVCQTGNPPNANEYKCQLLANATRTDLACVRPGTPTGAARDIGLCVPICQSDAACGGGRFCDFTTGVCVDAVTPALPIGSACTVSADCGAGLCFGGFVGGNFCTARCTYPSTAGCGFPAVGVPEGARLAGCLDPAAPGGGFGDLGICTQLCDVQTDCAQADWTCEDLTRFGDPTLPQRLGRFGFCNPPAPDAGAP